MYNGGDKYKGEWLDDKQRSFLSYLWFLFIFMVYVAFFLVQKIMTLLKR